MTSDHARIVGVVPGDPSDLAIWSGSSRHLLRALGSAGVLVGAVDARPPLAELIEKAASFSPDGRRWRQRFSSRSSFASPLARRAWTHRATDRLNRVAVPFDAVLQVGGWCDVTPAAAAHSALACSYHDGNLATYLTHPDLVLDRSSQAIRRAWDAERRLYDGLDLIFPMSDWVRRSFIEDFAQDPSKVITVGAGANLPAIPEPPDRRFESPRILFVGKGDFTRKGGPQLLAAFERVRETSPDAELWLVGPERPLAERPGVRWLGRIHRSSPDGESEIDRLYREATVYAMPSRHEPFGIAFLEAMAYGLPCVGGSSCAMPEIVEDGVSGLVVEPGDVDALAGALIALATDTALARRMGAAGRRRYLDRYTWTGTAQRIVAAVGAHLELAPR